MFLKSLHFYIQGQNRKEYMAKKRPIVALIYYFNRLLKIHEKKGEI